MGFREEFAKLAPGPERENLVYNYVIRSGKPKTVPVSIPGPNGTKITYHVMPDYVSIEGIRVPMTANTAQKIANYFGMHLPNANLAQTIHNYSISQGNAIPAKPLSGKGAVVQVIDNKTGKPLLDKNGNPVLKRYSGNEVVSSGVNNTGFSLAYNDAINKELAGKGNLPNAVYSGYFKDILEPIKGHENRMALYGMYDANGKPIQGGNGLTPHDTENHSEYGSGARLVSDIITIEKDGKKINVPFDKIKNYTQLSNKLSYVPSNKYSDKEFNFTGPPPGYVSAKFPNEDIKNKIQQKAKNFLSNPMYYQTIIEEGGRKYLAKIEPHSNAPKGVSVYELKNQSNTNITQDNKTFIASNKKKTLLDKIEEFVNMIS